MSKLTDAIIALAAAVETSDVEGVTVEVYKGGEKRNPTCSVTVYPTHRVDEVGKIGAFAKSTGGAKAAAEQAIATLGEEAAAKAGAASKVLNLIVVLVACLLMIGCVSAATEHAIAVNAAAFDGMVRTIEEGVTTVAPDGAATTRRLTYDELVLYVYAGRYAMHAVSYAVGVTDEEPNCEALGPPGGWIVAPVAPATPGASPGGR